MKFEYAFTLQANADIEIEDIGNCCISVTNSLYHEYILIIKTRYGTTEVIEYGPLQIDSTELLSKVYYSYNRFDFNDGKITRLIDNFINDTKKFVTQVELISVDTAKSRIKDLVQYL